MCTTTRSEVVLRLLDFFIKFAFPFLDKWMSYYEPCLNPQTYILNWVMFQLHFGRWALKYTHKYEWIREQLNALDKLYFSIKSFQLNTCNEGFRGDCAFFHMGSRNKYSKHLAFQFRIFDITVDLDSTLLIKFKILGVSMYKSFLSPKFGLSHFGLDFFWIWLSVRIF